MTDYRLDTDAVIMLIGRKSPTMVDRILAADPGTITVSSVVVHELFNDANKSTGVEHDL